METLLNSKRKLLADYQITLFGLRPELNLSLEILLDAIKSYADKKTFLTLNGVIDIAIQQSGSQKIKINLDICVYIMKIGATIRKSVSSCNQRVARIYGRTPVNRRM